MRRHQVILRGLLASVLLAALALMSSVVWRRSQLNWASRRIVQRYSEQISLLSEHLVARPDWSAREENWELEQEAVERLAQAFTDDAFYSVSVGVDGHHGLSSIKDWESRGPDHILTRGVLWAQGAEPEHKVYMGWSTTGETFYVYEGWVPEAEHMWWFDFWIYRSSLRGAHQ